MSINAAFACSAEVSVGTSKRPSIMVSPARIANLQPSGVRCKDDFGCLAGQWPFGSRHLMSVAGRA